MPHYVKPTISDWGVRLAFSCDEPADAMCRITCPPEFGCETFVAEKIDGVWHHVEVYDDDGEEAPHKMIPAPSCIILDWDALEECYIGEEEPLREGKITFSWSGDYYEWRYSDAVQRPSE